MAISKLKGERAEVQLWTELHLVESSALDQLKATARLPVIADHIAVMPDVHYGEGATVGSVIPLRGAVIPAAVGVDIGCGMGAIRLGPEKRDLPAGGVACFMPPEDDWRRAWRFGFEAVIPLGPTEHDRPAWKGSTVETQAQQLLKEFAGWADEFVAKENQLLRKHKSLPDPEGKASKQLGTLGGGNHFIEVVLDEQDRVWLFLHSGSRNVGKRLAEVHMAIAKTLEHNKGLGSLAYFIEGTPEFNAYLRDLLWAQRYAALNRQIMAGLLIDWLREEWRQDLRPVEEVWCHHNYVALEEHMGEKLYVTRKGAIRAGVGEMGLIPGSMGTRSYVVRGLGNADSFSSASHGAGRTMSRGDARRAFEKGGMDLEVLTAGVECRKDAGVADESPAAYKPIDQVMEFQKDLVEPVHELRQILNVKG